MLRREKSPIMPHKYRYSLTKLSKNGCHKVNYILAYYWPICECIRLICINTMIKGQERILVEDRTYTLWGGKFLCDMCSDLFHNGIYSLSELS